MFFFLFFRWGSSTPLQPRGSALLSFWGGFFFCQHTDSPLTVSRLQKTETINRLLNKQVGRAPSSSSSTSPTPKSSSGAGAGAEPGNKRSRSRLNKSITAGDEWEAGEDDEGGAVALNKRARVEVKPFVARWISSIKPLSSSSSPSSSTNAAGPVPGPAEGPPTAEEPTYHCTYSLPESRTSELASFVEALDNNNHHQPPPVAAASTTNANENGGGGGAAPGPAAAGSGSGSKEIKRRREPLTRRYTQEEKEANRKRNEDGWRKVLLGAA